MGNIPDVATEGDAATDVAVAPSGKTDTATDPPPDGPPDPAIPESTSAEPTATGPAAPEPVGSEPGSTEPTGSESDAGTDAYPEPVAADPPAPEPADATPLGTVPPGATEPPSLGDPAPAVGVDPSHDGWGRPTDWQVERAPHQVADPAAAPHQVPATQHYDEPDEYDDEWSDEYDDGALFASIFSAPSLALAAFVFALTGLLGGMIPESLQYLVQVDPTSGPAYHLRILGLIGLGFAIVAASLGLAAMLRSIGSPLRWPRYLGGAAVLLALLIALQSVLMIVLAGLAPEQGGMN